jgi:hypothetical protein
MTTPDTPEGTDPTRDEDVEQDKQRTDPTGGISAKTRAAGRPIPRRPPPRRNGPWRRTTPTDAQPVPSMTASTQAQKGSTRSSSSSERPVLMRSAATCSVPAHTIRSTSSPGRWPACSAVAA